MTWLKRNPVPVALLALLILPPLTAQQRPPAPVRYTVAREHSLRRAIQLTGTVESRTTSRVATTIAGLVEAFPGREGVRVKKGQTLAKLRRTTRELRLQSTEGQLREAETRLEQAETFLQRAQELYDSQVISQQRYDDAAYEVNAWKGKVAQLKADSALLKDDLARLTIRAPFSGVVVQELTEVGQWLKVGDEVVELISTSNLEVIVAAPERYFRLLKRGARAKVRFESLPGLEISGRVTAVVPRADASARTFRLKIRISNRRNRVSAGMLAQVSFQAGDAYQATMVPKDAVVTEGRRKMVYLLNSNNTVRSVPVQTGEGAGSWVAVTGPIRPGQKVITRGNERLRPGQMVQARLLKYKSP